MTQEQTLQQLMQEYQTFADANKGEEDLHIY